MVFDTQNWWAIDDAMGPRNIDKKYLDVVQDYYKVLWKHGINVDVIDETCPLDNYKLVIAPMTYMIRGDYAKRVTEFVRNGGTYVSTFWSGITDENDLTFLGGFPGPLKEVLGIWDEEIECLEDEETVKVKAGTEEFDATHLCALIHPQGNTKVLATFNSDFFKDYAAVTVNTFENGNAYYVASRIEYSYLDKLLSRILGDCGIDSPIEKLPYAVSCHTRYNADTEYLFIGNYSDKSADVTLKETYVDVLSEHKLSGMITINSYDFRILKKQK